MAKDRLAHNDVMTLAGALWNILRRDYPTDLRGFETGQWRSFTQLEPVDSRKLRSDTERVGWNVPRSLEPTDALSHKSQTTIASFVQNTFVPEHVAFKSPQARAHYRAMLKHVLKPEEVNQMLGAGPRKSRQRFKTVPGWPYLSDVRLCEMRPEHVSRLTAAAAARGYSPHTVTHLRNVVGAIFAHAKREQYLNADNPVSLLRSPGVRQKCIYSLTLAQAQNALRIMRYPEREMRLIAVFSDMNLAEILGLQWKYVNLNQVPLEEDGTHIPPWTIAVRDQLYRGRLIPAKGSRVRNLPIPTPLLQVLIELKCRERFIRPNDFVLVSHMGTPVNQNNILARRLRPIARQLGVPSLSCRAFQSIREALASELERQFQAFSQITVPPSPSQEDRELLGIVPFNGGERDHKVDLFAQ